MHQKPYYQLLFLFIYHQKKTNGKKSWLASCKTYYKYEMKANSENMAIYTVNEKQLKDLKK